MENYNKLSEYNKKIFGEKTLKICVDGGFTCPNRDNTKGINGCIFCSEEGSGELIKNRKKEIKNQVKEYLNSYKALRANKFIVYFQNFTNTYDTIENLKEKYDEALADKRIVGIDIATRPDCINNENAKLIASYKQKLRKVYVELGLQTADDSLEKFLNRKYLKKDFQKANKILKENKIDVIAHIMCGLPHENREKYFNLKNELNSDEYKIKNELIKKENIKKGKFIPSSLIETIKFINEEKIVGIKIHSTYVVKNTILEEMYNKGEYIPLDFNEYLYYLIYIITHLNKKIIIHRVIADAPKNILVAPEWNKHKLIFLNTFQKILKENNYYQGMFE